MKEEGVVGLFRGWAPTFFNYWIQGACKYSFYEYFKKQYSDYVGPQNAVKYKTLIYLAGSASAEVIADVSLCPFEAVKVRVQMKYIGSLTRLYWKKNNYQMIEESINYHT